MRPYRGFADLIRARRKELRITLQDVATATSWSIPYVSELERGIKQPPVGPGLKPLAAVLHLAYRDLAREAELSRRSVEIDIEGAGRPQRQLAVLLARRIQEGIPDDQVAQLLDALGGVEDHE